MAARAWLWRQNVTGERRPITREGLKTAFRRILPAAQIENFRFHDNRHTAATRVLRAGGNLKTVQRLLRHENIATTTKYAHVSDEDVMQAAAERAEAAKAELREREQGEEVPPEKQRDAG
ncbi:tyrosine-type recombinase/integrase [Methylobacterium aquaticum]|jgi:site-specific recombinase XerD|uniref:tyrosine-type recombinase/integrase n=1 Tax=Methylobacterium aquaticum TaxID=270351 RepID=UPI003D16A2C1